MLATAPHFQKDDFALKMYTNSVFGYLKELHSTISLPTGFIFSDGISNGDMPINGLYPCFFTMANSYLYSVV